MFANLHYQEASISLPFTKITMVIKGSTNLYNHFYCGNLVFGSSVKNTTKLDGERVFTDFVFTLLWFNSINKCSCYDTDASTMVTKHPAAEDKTGEHTVNISLSSLYFSSQFHT